MTGGTQITEPLRIGILGASRILEAFAAHLHTGAPLGLGIDDAVANMVLLDDAYRAAGLPPRPTYRA